MRWKRIKKKTFCKKVFSYATKQMPLEYQDLYCNFKDQLIQKLKSCMYFPVTSDESCNISDTAQLKLWVYFIYNDLMI